MKKTLSIYILTTLLACSTTFTTEAQTVDKKQTIDVDRKKYPDYTEKLNIDWSLMAPSSKDGEAARARTRAQRPDHVNNAETRYFPPVFNQDGGSCGSASRICYMFSYEMAAYRDLDGSKAENYYPSHFVWLHTNSPSSPIDQGKNGFVQHVGVPSAATYGGQTYSSLFGNQDCADNDFGWMQGYDKWYEAMHNRMLQPVNFPQSVETEEGREAVKNWLWNHNGDNSFHAGGICGIGVASGGVWKAIPKTKVNDEIGVTGMSYVHEWGTRVDHALTVVGYDDRIEFDLDKDGIIGEPEADEVGAWIIVNSWGRWENDGFIYCPYAFAGSAFNNDGTFTGNFWWPEIYKVRKDYRPLRTIKLEMDYSRRSEIALSAGISADLNATEPEKSIHFVHFTYAGDGNYGNSNPAPEIPMLGRWADGKLHTEPMEFGYDLTDLTDGYDMNQPLKYFFIVDTKSWAQGKGTIYHASIMDYRYDKHGLETPFAVGDGIEIKNQGKRTIITVTVQGTSYHAPQNAVHDGTKITWQAPLRSASTIKAYNIYQNNILIASLPTTTTTYTPTVTVGTGEYGISALYEDGNESSLEIVKVPEKLSSPNIGIKFSQSGFTIPGIFASKYPKATIEFWIKPTSLCDWNQRGGPGWGTFLFHANANGRYTAGWNYMNTERVNTNATLKTGQWTHVAIVVDNNKTTVYLDGTNRGSITSSNFKGIGGFGDLVFSSDGAQNAQDAVYDEIRIWNTARTADQIKTYKNTEFTGNLVPQGLIAYFKGDFITDNEGNQRLRDCVGGYHATLQGNNYNAVSNALPSLSTPSIDPVVSINKPQGTVYAGIPVTLNATYNDAVNKLLWTAEGAGINNLAVASPTLTFSKVGTHSVSVTAINAKGATATSQYNITVEKAPAPDATFTMTASNAVPAGERVTLHANNPRMGYLYQWNMPNADIQQSTSPSTSTSWQAQGTYRVTLTVTAPDGTKKSHTESIDVVEVAPEAALNISPTVILKGETVTLNDESLYTPLYREWRITNGSTNYFVYADATNLTIDVPGVYDVTLDVANNSGKSTLTRERAIIVTNADSENGLLFGSDDATVTAKNTPLDAGQTNFTIEWWMNPEWPADNTNGIGNSEETMILKTMGNGQMRLYVGGKYAAAPEGYVIPNEWHHYAVTFNKGRINFYRDGILKLTRPIASTSALPEIGAFRIGGTAAPFKGSIDELRVWGKVLTDVQLQTYANAPIENVEKAEIEDYLLLYYHFNQSGGDVQDATSNANHGTRTKFGPDGDAWGLSKGVFCLNFDTDNDKDITSQYLTNYVKPFEDNNKCINPNLPTQTFGITGWRTEGTINTGGITTGVHVDHDKSHCFTITTTWDEFADRLNNHKVFQTITLPVGYYTFIAEYDDEYVGQCGDSYLVAHIGNTLPTTEQLGEALTYTAMKDKDETSSNALSFMLTEESTVSIGILANMSGARCMTIKQFSLIQSDINVVGSTREIPSEVTFITCDNNSLDSILKGIYDLTGRKLRQDSQSTQGLTPGLYIIDGQKTIVK